MKKLTDEERKQRQKERARAYRQNNKQKIREMKLRYEAQPHRRAKKRAKSRQEYLDNKEKILLRSSKRRLERKKIVDYISLKYSCQNSNCSWRGEFNACQLAFHHVNQEDKVIEVAKMFTCSLENIIKEINKCIVLCHNCHHLLHRDKDKVIFQNSMMCNEDVNDYINF